MELKAIRLESRPDLNLILGQAHFIKTVEDLHEALAGSVPGAQFGLAFCESSGPCLVRSSGTDPDLTALARENALRLAAGHVFIVFLRGAFPINVLNAVKMVPEVCAIFCASANPVEAIVAETEQGRGVLGVVDGSPPKGAERKADVDARRRLLRKFGYKL